MKTFEINTNERQLSENLYMSLNTRHTNLNNNILVIGGSGAGKTFRFIKPLLMSMSSSFIITDPKGEILRDCGQFLKNHEYNIKVFNLLDMCRSNHYNPFVYIRNDTDIIKLVSNFMQNTAVKGATPADPFWDNACEMLLMAIFFYIRDIEPPERQNFRRVMELIAKTEFTEDARGNKQPSELDRMFAALEEAENARFIQEQQDYDEGKREDLPAPVSQAVQMYNNVMKGAADTVRSIMITAKARLRNLTNKEILNVLDYDEMNIRELGLGKDEDGSTKTALFCVIPDNDKSYNFLVGMLYTQIFTELYAVADFECDGRLPIHVTFALDEFANVALPDGFCSLLSTMRSREISSVIIIQNMAQIKELFEKTWETIPGNCDSLIYLGGNEQSTHEYISKMLGKGTYAKQSTGITKSRQGSFSKNDDVIGRELMLPSEVRKVDGNNCLVFIRGFDPIIDKKIRTQNKPMFKEMKTVYIHNVSKKQIKKGIMTVSPKKLKRLEKSGKAKIVKIDGDTLMSCSNAEIDKMLASADNSIDELTQLIYEHKIAVRLQSERKKEQQSIKDEEKTFRINIDSFVNEFSKEALLSLLKLRKQGFTDKQIKEMYPLFKINYDVSDITEIFDSSMTAEEIHEISAQLTM